MTVDAEIKDGVIYFSENGKVTYRSVIEQALMDLRWAGKHQSGEIDYSGCLAKPEPQHIMKTRGNNLPDGLYRMKGHSICEYCEYHYNLADDPAGACIEDVAIYAHFEDCIHGPIDAEDFLTGRLPVKELIDGKVIVNCPKYKFNSDPTAEATP